MKNITLISGYYFPEDTAIGLYNTQMVDFLESKGYNVTVITGFPSYPQWKIWDNYKTKPFFFKEKTKKTEIYRYKQYVPKRPTFFKRILLIVDFTLGNLINTFKIKKCDLVICIVPFTSCAFLGWILKKRKKAKLWNHIQDFEFDAALQTGISDNPGKIKKILFNLLFKVETALLNFADINSTISFSMLKKLNDKSCKETFYFPNWINKQKFDNKNENKHSYLMSEEFKILYSGNIGDKQDWDFFITFSKALLNLKVKIIVVGDGAKKNWLLDQTKNLNNVVHYQPVQYNELPSLLSSANLHILFQKEDVIDSVMPSKLLGMMASGIPSLITGNNESEVKNIIEKSEGGYYFLPQDIEKCINIVKMFMKDAALSTEIGKKAKNYIFNEFSNDKVFDSFENKLNEII